MKMKNVKKYSKIFLGCLLIAISLNVFFVGMNLIPAGIFGLAALYNYKVDMDMWLIIALANVFFLVLGFLALPKKKIKKAVLPFILIPTLSFLTKDIGSLIDINSVDAFLLALYGGVIMGLGYRFIYKENRYVSGSDIIAAIEHEITDTKRNISNYIIDLIILMICIYSYGFESSMYSLIAIIIIEILSKRASLGTSDSKVFYIITKKDREVRDFIIDEMHYELTVFDVKGGFMKTKNKVLMTVIPTKDYYKLREGVKMIDPTSFISITDSYEVINQNRHLIKDKN